MRYDRRLYVVTKTYRDLVLAEGDQEAFDVFNRHVGEMYSEDSEALEIKDLDHMKSLGFEGEHQPWGTREDLDAQDILDEIWNRAWEARRPVHVVTVEDVGCYIKQFELCPSKEQIGRVVYRLGDGRMWLETDEQRAEREETNDQVQEAIDRRKKYEDAKRLVAEYEARS